jgi:adenosinetriphosphatase
MLRRTKDLVVKLPDKIEYDIWLPLSPSAGLWYQRLLELTASATEDTTSLRKLLGAVVKIRICW